MVFWECKKLPTTSPKDLSQTISRNLSQLCLQMETFPWTMIENHTSLWYMTWKWTKREVIIHNHRFVMLWYKRHHFCTNIATYYQESIYITNQTACSLSTTFSGSDTSRQKLSIWYPPCFIVFPISVAKLLAWIFVTSIPPSLIYMNCRIPKHTLQTCNSFSKSITSSFSQTLPLAPSCSANSRRIAINSCVATEGREDNCSCRQNS